MSGVDKCFKPVD